MGMIQDFQKADEERRGEIRQLQHEVATMLKDFDKEFADDCAKEATQRKSEVTSIRSDVATMLKDFDREFAEDCAKEATQRKSEVASLRSDVATMLEELAREDSERKSGVATMRSEVAAIHEMVWGKAPARKVATPTVEELPEEMPAEEAAVEDVPVGELGDRVLAYLAGHPMGTRLVELEEEFGLARIQIAKVIRALIDGNKVDKRELLYFAI